MGKKFLAYFFFSQMKENLLFRLKMFSFFITVVESIVISVHLLDATMRAIMIKHLLSEQSRWK